MSHKRKLSGKFSGLPDAKRPKLNPESKGKTNNFQRLHLCMVCGEYSHGPDPDCLSEHMCENTVDPIDKIKRLVECSHIVLNLISQQPPLPPLPPRPAPPPPRPAPPPPPPMPENHSAPSTSTNNASLLKELEEAIE